MEKRNQNIMVVSIIALCLVLIGVTYAYFSARITGLESASTISLTAGRMGIVYSEGDENVSVSNIYPRSEEWLTKTITLTGYNTTDQEMEYDLGFNITNNTFLDGQLTFSLTGVGSNGTKISNITEKSINQTSGFLRIGTGSFLVSNGDTHVYTLKIFFKDNGKDQNFNQEAVFNAKLHVKEHDSSPQANINHNGKHCVTDDYVPGGTISIWKNYIIGQYVYRYGNKYTYQGWMSLDSNQNGWGVHVKSADDGAVTSELCAYINEMPVVSMAYMFYKDNSSPTVSSVDLSSFDTSNVTDMNAMFLNSSGLYDLSLDVSTFDTSNVTNMRSMFSYSRINSITGLDSFDTSSVTDMASMFYGIKATSLDLSSFDTSNVTEMSSMFSQATSLETIYASSGFVTANLVPDATGKGSYSMFSSCTSLVGGAGTTYNASYVNKARAHIDEGPSNPGYFTAK